MSTPPPFPLVFLFLLLDVLLHLPCLTLSSSIDPIPAGCPPASCGGTIVDIYPFWLPPNTSIPNSTYCGYPDLQLLCIDGRLTKNISIGNGNYTFLDINHTARIASVVDADLVSSSCPVPSRNLSYQETRPLYLAPGVVNTSFYFNCSPDLPGPVPCLQHNGTGRSYVLPPGDSYFPVPHKCESIVEVPSLDATSNRLEEIVKKGFHLAWDEAQGACGDCESSGGRCAIRQVSGFLCLCADGEHPLRCNYRLQYMKKSMKIRLGIAAIAVILVLILVIFCITKTTCSSNGSNHKVEEFLSSHAALAVRRYTSYQVRRMTASYSTKLGQGGYGTVYKGALPDGTLVAVKLLKDTKGTGDEFINEVASIGRTNHVNVVSLLGFCSERAKRALIYEFMPNGSLEKYLFADDRPATSIALLGWEQLHDIAVGIAKGLEYLHRGCNTRMVHFDIKPHNILLDKDFRPKISDFGLAKLHKDKESYLSSVLPRGTIGYIAPEVFFRNFGVVSSKSDVYSYGMMVLEMVGGRRWKATSPDQETSELYFPHWIYEHLDEEDCGLRECGVVAGSEEIVRKMVLVGLWCIQTNPSSRPLISKVVEMLEGSVDNLEIPPKPYMCSPERTTHTSDKDTLPTISGSL